MTIDDCLMPTDEQTERACALAAKMVGRDWDCNLEFDKHEREQWRVSARAHLLFAINKDWLLAP